MLTQSVSVQYDNLAKPVFSNVNITVAAGESLALIGECGVSETTLLKVISGLLTPESGEILIGVKKIGVNNYQACTACLLQEYRLFSGSIADNISGFDDNAGLQFITDCPIKCNIHDEIMCMLMDYDPIIDLSKKIASLPQTMF